MTLLCIVEVFGPFWTPKGLMHIMMILKGHVGFLLLQRWHFWHGDSHCLPMVSRHYPKGLGRALVSIFKTLEPQGDLRGKPDIPTDASDKELFEQEPLGDPWWDAGLPDVFFYLIQNKRLKIPDSWYDTMMAFKEELASVSRSAQSGLWTNKLIGITHPWLDFLKPTIRLARLLSLQKASVTLKDPYLPG